MLTLLMLLAAPVLADEPTTEEVIAAAEEGGLEEVRDKVVPGLDITVETTDTFELAFDLLSATCAEQESAELEKACDARVAEAYKTFTGTFTTTSAELKVRGPYRRLVKGGFVVIID